MSEEDVKEKHLATVKCPDCGIMIEIIERETIIKPYQKKISEKEIIAKKSEQTTLA